MPLATSSSKLGIARETTRGTIQAPTAWIPYKGPTPKDTIKYLADTGMRGSAVAEYGQVQSVKVGEFDLAGDLFLDTTPHLLMAVLGGTDTVVGTASPYSHSWSLLNNAVSTGNQPPSFTLSDSDGFEMRQFAAAQFSDFTLKVAVDGTAEWSAKAMSYPSAATTVASDSFSTVRPTPGWDLTVNVASSPNIHMESGELAFTRPVVPIYTGQGTTSQTPYRLFAGPFSLKGKATWVIEDDTELNYYLNNTQPEMDWTIVDPNASTTSLKVQMTQVAFTIGTINRGKEYIQVDTEFSAVPNATDASSGGVSPCKITVVNTRSTAY